MSKPSRNALTRSASLAAMGLAVALGCVTASSAGPKLVQVTGPRLYIPETPVQLPPGTVTPRLTESNQLIHAVDARLQFGVDGSGLTAAVIDSGILASHQDFPNKIVAARNFTTEHGGDPDNVSDTNGHGTHVAGCIAAKGVHTGIAPGANLAVLKCSDTAGTFDFNNVIRALDWVLANKDTFKISVVNISAGDGRNYTGPEGIAGVQELTERIVQLRNAGIPVVTAAGNTYFENGSVQGMNYPGIVGQSISVGAVYDSSVGGFSYPSGARANTTKADQITPFSKRLHSSVSAANATDFFAPGAPVISTGTTSSTASSSQQGTSQAAPITVGAIMLMQQFYVARRGTLPSVASLENWIRNGAATIVDGDDEDDNVQHTGHAFSRIDVQGAIAQMANDLGSNAATFSIRGRVTAQNGSGLGGATVSVSGKNVTTAADGSYEINPLAPGTYSVSCSKTGLIFSPASASVTVSNADATGVNFQVSSVAPPPTPSNVSATAVSAKLIRLTWSDGGDTESSYTVEYRFKKGKKKKFKVLGTVGANITIVDVTAAKGTTYIFRVFATNDGGNSAPSSEVTVKTPRK